MSMYDITWYQGKSVGMYYLYGYLEVLIRSVRWPRQATVELRQGAIAN